MRPYDEYGMHIIDFDYSSVTSSGRLEERSSLRSAPYKMEHMISLAVGDGISTQLPEGKTDEASKFMQWQREHGSISNLICSNAAHKRISEWRVWEKKHVVGS